MVNNRNSEKDGISEIKYSDLIIKSSTVRISRAYPISKISSDVISKLIL